MEERKEPRYAPGHELTLHPGDPVNGAELLEDEPEARNEEGADEGRADIVTGAEEARAEEAGEDGPGRRGLQH